MVAWRLELVLDTGTFHDFDDAQRKAMGRGVSAVAAPDATETQDFRLRLPGPGRPVHLRGMSDDLPAELAQQIHRVDWKPLAPHAKRGGLVLVDPQLDLLEVAVAVARDHGEQVQQWMTAQKLGRPTAAQAEAWRQEIGERFTVVIVQPYVLAQRDEVDSVKVE